MNSEKLSELKEQSEALKSKIEAAEKLQKSMTELSEILEKDLVSEIPEDLVGRPSIKITLEKVNGNDSLSIYFDIGKTAKTIPLGFNSRDSFCAILDFTRLEMKKELERLSANFENL